VTRGQLLTSCSSMPDHCRISSEIRSSFGHLEMADLALVGERLGVFSLLTHHSES
jgi:hypothetical protein